MQRRGIRKWNAILLATVLLLNGCTHRYTPPESPMPPNTILLSQMMRELSARPGFTETVLREIEGNTDGKRGPALLTPQLADELRRLILGKNWQGLDRFPGWTMRAITPTVGVVDKLRLRRHRSPADVQNFLDLGAYPLGQEQTVSLDKPSTFPPFTTERPCHPACA